MCPVLTLGSWTISLYEWSGYLGYTAAVIFFWRKASGLPGLKRDRFILAIVGSFFIQQYGGAVLPYLYAGLRQGSLPTDQPLIFYGRYFHSAFLSTALYIYLVCRWNRWPLPKMLDIFAVSATMMSAIGRLGCFFQGCCGGKPAPPPFGVRFPFQPEIPVYPTQLYMFAAETALVLLLLQIDRGKKVDGQTFWSGVMFYSLYRFGIEFLRTNPAVLGPLTHAQVFSVLAALLAVRELSRLLKKTPAVR